MIRFSVFLIYYDKEANDFYLRKGFLICQNGIVVNKMSLEHPL